ncbi:MULTISPECIES: hypothetical protein [Halorhodospira]|uniref:hypothetical protein n=1 Tax=Halorhodospira TaxID=85108 RepID=UPI001EE98841|nr:MULTISPECIES: hypothetical protein [Halorhodospira]MCG5528637.1 hypothetical protein [Halorhodospira halophila]MCG5543964.1 hypothetical protein [Halorhodospira sp. 9628]
MILSERGKAIMLRQQKAREASVRGDQGGGVLIISVFVLLAVGAISATMAALLTGRAETSSVLLDDVRAFYAAETGSLLGVQMEDRDAVHAFGDREPVGFHFDGAPVGVEDDDPVFRFTGLDAASRDQARAEHVLDVGLPINRLSTDAITQHLADQQACLEDLDFGWFEVDEICPGDPLFYWIAHLVDPAGYESDVGLELYGNRLDIPQGADEVHFQRPVLFEDSVTISIDSAAATRADIYFDEGVVFGGDATLLVEGQAQQQSGWTDFEFRDTAVFRGDVHLFSGDDSLLALGEPPTEYCAEWGLLGWCARSEDYDPPRDFDRLRYSTLSFGGDVYFGHDNAPELPLVHDTGRAGSMDSGISFDGDVFTKDKDGWASYADNDIDYVRGGPEITGNVICTDEELPVSCDPEFAVGDVDGIVQSWSYRE